MKHDVKFGVDRLLEDPAEYKKGRWGMVTNNSATCSGQPNTCSRKAMMDAGIPLVRLFSPEHGISGDLGDGEAVDDAQDPVTGLPVHSLYGQHMKPSKEFLHDLDGLFFDIPDIGARCYTYIWALSYVMEACAETGTPIILLDRINPLGGRLDHCEGPVLDTANCVSYLGRAPVPMRHGLTTGEFARWLSAEWQLQLDLKVIPNSGWSRPLLWPDTGLPFSAVSPAIQTFESALCYPGTCLFEATNLSVGRNTKHAFQVVGAPWLDPVALISVLRSQNIPGVNPEYTIFVPSADPYEGEECRGVALQITDRNAFRPVFTGLSMLTLIRNLFPSKFEWKPYPSAANPTGKNHFELLIGRYDWRKQLENNPEQFIQELPGRLSVQQWGDEVSPHLLYD